MRIVACSIHIVFLVGHGADLPDQRFGVGVASALHVGIEKKIHGVKLVAFAAHAHGSGFAGGGDGGEVGIMSSCHRPTRAKCAKACAEHAEPRERSARSGGQRASPVARVAACRRRGSDSEPRRDGRARSQIVFRGSPQLALRLAKVGIVVGFGSPAGRARRMRRLRGHRDKRRRLSSSRRSCLGASIVIQCFENRYKKQ